MKRGPQKRLDKRLSIKNLLKVVWKSFDIPGVSNTENRGLKQRITLKDCLKGAFAMFSLKSPSLLSFDLGSREKTLFCNLKNLYGLRRVPCDTYMREKLDVVDPRDLLQKNTQKWYRWILPLYFGSCYSTSIHEAGYSSMSVAYCKTRR